MRVVVETVVLVLVAIVLAVLVKTFFVQAFYIPSASMEPGLQGGPGAKANDRILVEKPSYWFGDGPSRGDIVVFKDPGDWLTADENAGPSGPMATLLAKIGLYPTGGHLVKRVIGVGGDKVVCCDAQGRISVNGTPLDEDSYIAPQTACNGPMGAGCAGWSATVPKGRLFVMGDNRAHSADSSYHLCKPADTGCDPNDAFVPVSDVVGKVFAVVWPAGDARWVKRPADFAAVASPPGG